jgi:hypothetical protein
VSAIELDVETVAKSAPLKDSAVTSRKLRAAAVFMKTFLA